MFEQEIKEASNKRIKWKYMRPLVQEYRWRRMIQNPRTSPLPPFASLHNLTSVLLLPLWNLSVSSVTLLVELLEARLWLHFINCSNFACSHSRISNICYSRVLPSCCSAACRGFIWQGKLSGQKASTSCHKRCISDECTTVAIWVGYGFTWFCAWGQVVGIYCSQTNARQRSSY